jgi:predicted HicB family RNase H-like nuclease
MKNAMRIGQFNEYKGYKGSIEYDFEDKLHHGKLLDIDDLVNYHASNIVDLFIQYHEAVDDYIDFKKEIGKE